MNFGFRRPVWLAVVFVFALSTAGFASAPCGVPNQLYCQGEDGTGVVSASQNDTTGGLGHFATAYDNFTFDQREDVQSFHWVGGYFTGTQAPITAWTLTFYNDQGGQPGSAFSTQSFNGDANETFLGTFGAQDLYTYDLSFSGVNMGPGTFWVSVVPDLGFPPQWGWAEGSGGDGIAYQDFFGERFQLGGDLAFAIDGTVASTPEPGTLVMLGTGILGLAGTLRRKLS